MRKIGIKIWKAKDSNGKDYDESLLSVFNVLMLSKKPEEIPKGLDNFRLMSRIAKAFDKAENTKILELEEADYSFLKKTIESDIPSIWGTNNNILEAVTAFLEAKPEE